MKTKTKHPVMSKKWLKEEMKEHHVKPFTHKWMVLEKKEGHKSLMKKSPDWAKWKKEEAKEAAHGDGRMAVMHDPFAPKYKVAYVPEHISPETRAMLNKSKKMPTSLWYPHGN